jgi:hypothetical protein
MTKIVQSIGHLQAVLSRPQTRFDAMPMKRVVRGAHREKESSCTTAKRRPASWTGLLVQLNAFHIFRFALHRMKQPLKSAWHQSKGS